MFTGRAFGDSDSDCSLSQPQPPAVTMTPGLPQNEDNDLCAESEEPAQGLTIAEPYAMPDTAMIPNSSSSNCDCEDQTELELEMATVTSPSTASAKDTLRPPAVTLEDRPIASSTPLQTPSDQEAPYGATLQLTSPDTALLNSYPNADPVSGPSIINTSPAHQNNTSDITTTDQNVAPPSDHAADSFSPILSDNAFTSDSATQAHFPTELMHTATIKTIASSSSQITSFSSMTGTVIKPAENAAPLDEIKAPNDDASAITNHTSSLPLITSDDSNPDYDGFSTDENDNNDQKLTDNVGLSDGTDDNSMLLDNDMDVPATNNIHQDLISFDEPPSSPLAQSSLPASSPPAFDLDDDSELHVPSSSPPAESETAWPACFPLPPSSSPEPFSSSPSQTFSSSPVFPSSSQPSSVLDDEQDLMRSDEVQKHAGDAGSSVELKPVQDGFCTSDVQDSGKRGFDDINDSFELEHDGIAEKRQKLNPALQPPTTKRMTRSSQKAQYRKLITPFRSPVVDRIKAASGTGLTSSSSASGAFAFGAKGKKNDPDARIKNETQANEVLSTNIEDGVKEKEVAKNADSKILHRTIRASLQFKSPLAAGAPTSAAFSFDPSLAAEGPSASSTGLSNAPVRLTPTIQSLEKKIQVLKRAIKVKESGEEKELEELVRKWREAGREVAWEVWDLIKERRAGARNETSGGGGGDGNWGWAGGEKKGFGGSWGWGDDAQGENGDDERKIKKEESAEDEEVRRDSLGVMLRELGIDPETLGWDEEQECFVGDG